jgi:hypothetical protein
MEPIIIITIFLLVIIIGRIISHFQRSKRLSKDPTHQKIEMLEEENYPEVIQEYKLEELNRFKSYWLENGIVFSDSQFQELYRISIQDENGEYFSLSKSLMDINLKFHGHEEHVYIVIECYYNIGNIMHIYSKNQPLLDSFSKAFNQAKLSENH